MGHWLWAKSIEEVSHQRASCWGQKWLWEETIVGWQWPWPAETNLLNWEYNEILRLVNWSMCRHCSSIALSSFRIITGFQYIFCLITHGIPTGPFSSINNSLKVFNPVNVFHLILFPWNRVKWSGFITFLYPLKKSLSLLLSYKLWPPFPCFSPSYWQLFMLPSFYWKCMSKAIHNISVANLISLSSVLTLYFISVACNWVDSPLVLLSFLY